MEWNIVPECTSLITIYIIFLFARSEKVLPTLRKFLFKLCIVSSLVTVIFNILTATVLMGHEFFPTWVLWVVNTFYYLTTPISGIFFMLYGFSVLTDDTKKVFRLSLIGIIPTIAYLIIALTNPFTHLLFNVLPDVGYVRGPCLFLAYIPPYIYCLIILIFSNLKIFDATRTERLMLAAFPVTALLAVGIQQFFGDQVLSGTATAVVLLIIYLTIENKEISLDTLTGTPSRQVLLDMLKLNLSRNTKTALIVLSLRKFKVINNRLGQPLGNVVLQQIARFLKTVSKGVQVYRFGGDEFAILVYNKQDVNKILSTISTRMNSAWDTGNCNVTLSAAIGVVPFDMSFTSVEEIILGMEHSVICAKQINGNSCVYCTTQMISDIHRRDNVIEILKNTIANNDIVLYYQPIFDVKSSKFLYAESLARIPNSPLGFLSPGEFIPIAESTGLIIPLTYQIMNKICLYVNELLAANVQFSAVHINFSAMQFSDEHFEEKILEIINRHRIPFSKIKIELTESILAENYTLVKDYIVRMNNQGLRFELDDFGTGYSNLSSVLQIPWDTIKLDRSLILSAEESESSALIVKNIVSAFLSLGICVLAEGVETIEQRDFATGIGCKLIQGFYYAKPLPPEEAKIYFKVW
ncbi:MAG: bifunctional diguanylate cyclase/phosphodiesterase [Oscillospiraceae bacterium]